METVIHAFNRESIRTGAFTVGSLCNETINTIHKDVYNDTLTQSVTYSVKEI